jgi:hypothetical protein
MTKQKNPYLGSSFEDFLKEEGVLEEVTHSATQRVLALLMEHGDDLSRVREVEHFAYFPTPDARAAFIDASIAAGFKLRRTSEPSEVTPLYGIILFHLDAPDEDALEKIIGMLSDLAQLCGGEYDGWETQVRDGTMPTTLTAHEQAISRIFSNDYVFRIPSYQRPYAWGQEQARELLEDLLGFMNAHKASVEEMPPYFLGSIVLIKRPDTPDADVVDGQQRLTTLTLLLSAIRASVEPSQGKDITQLIYEKGSQILGTTDRYRLSLRLKDQEFFHKYVQRDDGFLQLIEIDEELHDSRRNLRDNARLFHERLVQITPGERTKLAQFIVTRCYLVSVSTPDLDSAYRIFSVLNSRGLDLSATDILKAELIGGIPPLKRDEYTQRWEDCEDDLGREGFGELFSHIRMVYRKAKPQGTLLKEFKDHVTHDLPAAQFIDDVLIPMADVYREIVRAEYTSSSDASHVNTSLKWLDRIEFKDWLPPALAFAVRERNSPQNMQRFFGDLERLAYALLITRAGVNERVERFSKLTGTIQANEDLWAKSSPLQLTEDDQYRVYSVLSGPIYNDLGARARSTVLLRLDNLISGGGASYDFNNVTVEHVLPQNPEANSIWMQWFPDEKGRAVSVHKLGNLALLTKKKNSSASNYDFSKKKNAYFTINGVSPFAITTQVLTFDEWTPSVIEARQAKLLAELEKHWRLQGRKDSLLDVLG